MLSNRRSRRPFAPFLVIPLLIVAVVLTNCGAPAETPTPTPGIEAVLSEIALAVSQIRGLPLREEVEPVFLTEEEFRTRLEELFEREYPVAELQRQQQVLVMLDLLPADYDLREFLFELLEEQVIGLYDDETGEMVIRGIPQQIGALEKLTFSHEYTHALQDQYVGLKSLPLDVGNNSDVSMAALSLVEGDATLTASLYAYEYLDLTELNEAAQSASTDTLESAPAVVREVFLFPYQKGTTFVESLVASGGWTAVNEAFQDLPETTEQIIHPEKYAAREQPCEIAALELQPALGANWSQVHTDVMGELNLRIYLEAFVDSSTAAAAAEGWCGDRYVLWQDADSRELLVLSSAWDTVDDASEFFDAYEVFVSNKGQGFWSTLLHGEDARWWNGPAASVYLSRDGDNVLLIIAPDSEVVGLVLAEYA